MNEAKDTSSLGSLKFLTGPLAGTTYQIIKPTINLGRDPANDIAISDPSVSRHHAQILLTGDVWVVKKLAAQNKLLLNKREIEQSPLVDRDTVSLGSGTTFLFEAVAKPVMPTGRVEMPQNAPLPSHLNIRSTTPVQRPMQAPQPSQPSLQG